ncbi:MAG: DNA gyrase/topoisomerase IV subunit A, partial [Muribaculaceae bacterium]|nr:DNA gyrase/topoisomerase IV subunit A [Muribaculaceae bacterium]
ILNDADQKFPYIKRFKFEPTIRKQRSLGDNVNSTLILLTDTRGARFEVKFAAPDDFREPLTVDAWDFIGEKSVKARGKRLTTYAIESVEEIEPLEINTPDTEPAGTEIVDIEDADAEEITPDTTGEAGDDATLISDEDLRDEINGQQKLF